MKAADFALRSVEQKFIELQVLGRLLSVCFERVIPENGRCSFHAHFVSDVGLLADKHNRHV